MDTALELVNPQENEQFESGLASKVFSSTKFGDIRVVMINTEPWFVGKDLVTALGYKNGSRDLNRHVDPEDRQNYHCGTFKSPRGMTVVNESGMYALILGSNLDSAKQFKHWVTSEVLPSIRKTGAYSVQKPSYRLPQSYEEALEDLLHQVKENKRLTAENRAMQPKALFYDAVNASEDCITFEEMAKLLKSKGVDIGRNRLMRWLRDESILTGKNLPYQKYINAGLFKVKETVFTDDRCKSYINTQTLITPKGQDRIIKSFASYLR